MAFAIKRQTTPGQKRPKFHILYSKKYTGLKKVHHRR